MVAFLIVSLSLIAAVGYLRVKLDRAQAENRRLRTMLEAGETIRRDTAERLADAPVVMRLHLRQSR